jgi:hypothetical protein
MDNINNNFKTGFRSGFANKNKIHTKEKKLYSFLISIVPHRNESNRYGRKRLLKLLFINSDRKTTNSINITDNATNWQICMKLSPGMSIGKFIDPSCVLLANSAEVSRKPCTVCSHLSP